MALLGRTLLCVAALLGVTAAVAQSGGIVVRVYDSEGAPLPGATVTLSHETGYVKTTAELTDDDGKVEFPVLRPGEGYVVQVAHPGFSPIRYADLRVRINEPLKLSVTMIEELREQVRVETGRELIRTDDSASSVTFSDDFISDLPVEGRFYQNVLPLAPGVQDVDGDGNPNVHGSRERDFAAMIGGVRNVDPLTGYWMSRINPNSIEEIEVITAGAGVEFGRAQGGFARILQKQGNNEHEGTFEFYYRNSEFDRLPEGTEIATPEYQWVQPALHLSGPILRDRLWYRLSHEYRSIEEPVSIPTRASTTITSEWTHSDQLTWQVSPRNKLAFLFQSDPSLTENMGVSQFRPPESAWSYDRTGTNYSLVWTAPYSPRILLESLVSWQDLSVELLPTEPGIYNDCIEGGLLFMHEAECTKMGSSLISGSYYRTLSDRSQRLTVSGKATAYARFAGMSHQFKLGVSVENERYDRTLRQGPYGFYWRPIGLNPFARFLVRPSYPQTDDVESVGTNWAIYVEDQLKPAANLTVTIGLRVDREELTGEGSTALEPAAELQTYEEGLAPLVPLLLLGDLSTGSTVFQVAAAEMWPGTFSGFEDYAGFEREMQGLICQGVSAEWELWCHNFVSQNIIEQRTYQLSKFRQPESYVIENTNFSPFLGLAWSPGSDGKTAIKVSAGRHYNTIPLIVPLVEQEPALTELDFKRIYYPSWTLLGDIRPALTVQTVDRDLRTPYQDEFTLKIEREIFTETSIAATWIRRNFRDQIQDVNINLASGDFGKCVQYGGVEASPGSGFDVVDPVTGETHEDTSFGFGDGRQDDCNGDGRADLYVQNPFWGDVLFVTNANSIDYEAFVLELMRRQYRGWELQASYTWSEAIGDGEDFFQELGNDPSLKSDIFGYQSYDQRHVFKLQASTITPWLGLRAGGAVRWQSGVPFSRVYTEFQLDALPPILEETGIGSGRGRVRQTYRDGVRNATRNPSYWNVDVRLAKEFRVTRDATLQLSLEIFNLLNEQVYMIYDPVTRSGLQLNGRNDAYVTPGRRLQLGLRATF